MMMGDGPSNDAGEVIMDHQSTDTAEEHPFDDDVHTASSMDDNPISEGNVPCVQNVPTYNSSNRTDDDNPVFKYGLNKYANHTKLSADNSCFISNLNKTAEPTCYDEIVKDINWVQAMNNEMEALYLNNTWILTKLQINRKAIGSKWVYKIKYKSDGEVERYKTRVVAKGNNSDEISKFKTLLNQKFKIKDLGELKFFFGIEVLKIKNGLCLKPKEIRHELYMSIPFLACKPVATPMPENDLALLTMSIALANICTPLQSHFDAALRVLRSVFGIVFVCVGLVSMERVRKQQLFSDLLLKQNTDLWLLLFVSSAIQIAANPVMHEKIKHFDIDVHLIREKVASGLIKTVKVDSEEQIADILTKGLGSVQHMKLCSKLTLSNLFSS
ncbi:ribonuclease H-like domain-containing protein [Tanacetum coccineum]